MKPLIFILSLIIALMTNLSSAADGVVPLKSGDRVVFLGDSITQQGARPGGYVEVFKQQIADQLKGKNIEVINAGIGGHKVPDLQKRLERDVLSKIPTVVVIYIGINDVWHSIRKQGTSVEDFESGLVDLIEQIREKDARVILATPSVIGEKHAGENPLDGMLAQYAGITRKVAYDQHVQLIDLQEAFHHELEARNKRNVEKGILTTDGVHLNAAGNQFVAEQMLSAFGVTPMKSGKLLRHVVLFKFKEEMTEAQVQEIVDAFSELPGKIETIVDYEAGTDVSVENKAAGFTHGFIVSFDDAKGRDIYLPHPAHQEFVKLVGPRLDDVLVFDFYAK